MVIARRGAVVVLVAAAVLVACAHPENDPQRVTLTDDGAICLGQATESDGGEGGIPSGVDLKDGEPLIIGVRTPCLSNACTSKRTAKCSVKRQGSELRVTSELTWIGPDDLAKRCPTDCTFLESQCKTEPLPAGSYRVLLGARTLDLTLPSHLAVRCDRDHPPPAATGPSASIVAPVVATATPAANVDPTDVPAAPGTGVVATPPPGDTICIGPTNANKARVLKAGQPVSITVLHKNACLGASCTLAKAKCTVKRKGFDLTLDAQFPSATTKPTQPCSEDCSALAATCKTDGLPPGSYSLIIGAQKKTLQIPSSAPACSN